MVERERSYLSRDERRAQLLAVGLLLFSTRPYEDVSIDDIAAEAGASNGLLYHYFGGKRALYTEVVRFAAGQLLESIVPDSSRSNAQNLRLGVAAYFSFCERHKDAYLALMHGGLGADPGVQSVLEETRQAIVGQILDQLGLATPPPPFRMAARSWLGGVEAAAIEWLERPELNIDQLVDMLSAGLFGQMVVAARLSPAAGASIDLAVGFELLLGLGRG